MTNVSILKPKGYEEWRPMPDWCRWTAVDSDGAVGAFEDKPHVASRQWVADHGRFAVLGINPPMRALWEKSLTPVHGVKVPTSRSFADGNARQQLRRVILIGCGLLAALIWWAVSS
jgi:hypothetical protein